MSRPEADFNAPIDARQENFQNVSGMAGMEDGSASATTGGSANFGLDLLRSEIWHGHQVDKIPRILLACAEHTADGPEYLADGHMELSETKKAARRLGPQIAVDDYASLPYESRRVLEGVEPEDYKEVLNSLQEHLADELLLQDPPATVQVRLLYDKYADNIVFAFSDRLDHGYGMLMTTKRDPYEGMRAE